MLVFWHQNVLWLWNIVVISPQGKGRVELGKISAKKRREIINDYNEYRAYSKVAKKHGVCPQTVKRIVDEKKSKPVKGEASYDVMEHISKSSKEVCDLIDKYLAVMNDPVRLENAPLNQVASSLGVLVDKFTKGITKEKGSTDLEKVLEAVRDIE